jgi:hypothetical protein
LDINLQTTDAFFTSLLCCQSCKEDAIKGNIVTTTSQSPKTAVEKGRKIGLFKPACPKAVFDSERFYPLSVKNLPI